MSGFYCSFTCSLLDIGNRCKRDFIICRALSYRNFTIYSTSFINDIAASFILISLHRNIECPLFTVCLYNEIHCNNTIIGRQQHILPQHIKTNIYHIYLTKLHNHVTHCAMKLLLALIDFYSYRESLF